jgi:hypothetical protein
MAQVASKLDSTTMSAFRKDLILMDTPFKAPSDKLVRIKYNTSILSNKIKGITIERIDGKKVAKYKYMYQNGILTRKKLKSKNPDKFIYADGNFYYSKKDGTLLLAKYKLTKFNYTEYDITYHTKVYEESRLVDKSSQGYIVESSELVDAVPNPTSDETMPFSNSNAFRLPIGDRIYCSTFFNCYPGPFNACSKRYTNSGQLDQYIFLNNGVQTGYLQYFYDGTKISSVMLFHEGELIEQVFLFYDQNGNLKSFQRVN